MIRLILLALLVTSIDPVEIAKVNRLKKVAEQAYLEGNFDLAINNYHILLDSMSVNDDEIRLNLAHAYYQNNDTSTARSMYSQVSMSNDPKLKSIAYQQLGVMAKSPQSLKESLQYLKASLKADPTNEDARYDYEVVKKLIDQQNKEQQNKEENQENKDEENQENEDQQNQDQQDQQNQDKGDEEKKDQEQQRQDQQSEEEKEGEEQEQEQQQEGEEEQKDQQQDQMNTKEKLEEMNISEEKARMILEAMKNAEIQYLQQQKRKATKKPDSGKPDW